MKRKEKGIKLLLLGIHGELLRRHRERPGLMGGLDLGGNPSFVPLFLVIVAPEAHIRGSVTR